MLHLPDRHGHFQLYSDTSKFATGSALYQIQNGQLRLIAYASKRMPEAAKNYSITELGMCGLAMNIATFLHLLKKVDFDAIVDHFGHNPYYEKQSRTCHNQNQEIVRIIKSLFL